MPALPSAAVFVALFTFLVPVPQAGPAIPDDGMWTFDNPPLKILKEKYGFEPPEGWLDHVRKSCVRVSTGGSGSFVSPRGLVMTNHHVALELVNRLSSVESNFVKEGFLARAESEELRCPGAELRHLVSITDVTEAVQAAAEGAEGAAAAQTARDEAMARIAAEASEKSGLTVDVVTLYGGGKYAAYGYKTWNDVRLVFAPEMRIAYFGGDDDNFCYPRFCLDCAFLRAYEDGKPADTSAHFLKWSAAGPKTDELVFVAGHPGDTGRLLPFARIVWERDTYNPLVIDHLRSQEAALSAIAAKGEAQRLKVLDELFGVRNSLKAYEGQQAGLQDPVIMGKKEAEEAAFRKACEGDAEVAAAFAAIEGSIATRRETFPMLVTSRLEGELVTLAREMVKLAEALEKPEDRRPARLRGEELDATLESLARPRELDLAAQRLQLAATFNLAAKHLDAGHPFIRLALGDAGPEAAAEKLLASTKVADPEFRRHALEDPDGTGIFPAAADPLVKLIREATAMRAEAVARHQRAEAEEAEALTVLARARFKVYGTSTYPDATFTLRLSFGTATGYELGTTKVPWKTSFYGLFARNAEMDGREPFDLPERWLKARETLDLATPFNFVSTCDIIGGNSGSPVINRDAEVVGLIFDGNIQSLPGRYLFDERQNRSVSVHSLGITHALERVFRAYGLLAELGVR